MIFINMKLYERYKEVVHESQAQACISKFGQELFSPQLGGDEPNTGTENKYLKKIEKFTDMEHGESLSKEFLTAMEHLKSCTDSYSEVLIPTGEDVFRGISLPLGWFIKNNVPITKDRMPFLYNAKSLIQSWTESFEVAAGFAEGGLEDEMMELSDAFRPIYGKGTDLEDKFYEEVILKNFMKIEVPIVIIHKAVEGEFLFKAKYFDMISSNPNELEVLRLGGEPLDAEIKIPFDKLPHYAGKALLMIGDIIEYG